MSGSAKTLLTRDVPIEPYFNARGFAISLIQECQIQNNELTLGRMTSTREAAVQKAISLLVPTFVLSLTCIVEYGEESDISNICGQIGPTEGIDVPHYSSLSSLLRNQNLIDVGSMLAQRTIGQRRLQSMSNALQIAINDPSVWVNQLALILTPYLFGSLQRLICENGWESRERMQGAMKVVRVECISALPESFVRVLATTPGFEGLVLELPPLKRPRHRLFDVMFLLSVCLWSLAITMMVSMWLGMPLMPWEVLQATRPVEVEYR